MKTLVTGGAGFIGSHLVDALLAEGNEVTVLDNLSTGRLANLMHQQGNPRLRVVTGDIRDEPLIDRFMQDAEVVYHLAAAVGVRNVLEDPLGGMMTNAFGSEIVIRLAHKYNCRLLLASTSEIYGKGVSTPFHEEDDRLLGPTSVPRWSYSTSKALAEHLAYAYMEKGLRMSIVRYCNAYGPRTDESGSGSVIAKFVNQALRDEPITIYGGGWQTRCFTYVADSVRGTILAATKDEALGQAFNLGSDEEISISELAWLVAQTAGSESPIVHVPLEDAFGERFEETVRRVPAVDKAERLLGFKAEIPLSEGLKRTVDWFRRRGVEGRGSGVKET